MPSPSVGAGSGVGRKGDATSVAIGGEREGGGIENRVLGGEVGGVSAGSHVRIISTAINDIQYIFTMHDFN